MKLKYQVIDNFLPKEIFFNIKNIFTSGDIEWHYSKSVSKKENKDGFYFIHSIYKDHIINSIKYNLFIPILHKIKVKSLLRIKANLYTKTDKIIEHSRHKDYEFPHKGFIFYINTNNGFTRLKDGTKIESIENRGLFFDSHHDHNSSTCSDENVRININFNYF